LVSDLAPEHASHFADAICTTDRFRKVAARRGAVGRAEATVLGIAKGAGMIHPDMATTLLFVLTDASATAQVLRRALRSAAADTINAASVDGDTSTNDMLLALASARAPLARPVSTPRELTALTELFTQVLDALARSIVADGEGAEHVVTIEVTGAKTPAAARTIARTIATSPLVKTAFHGRDPNWGRLLAAAGRAGVRIDPGRLQVSIGEVVVARDGVAVGQTAEQAAHAVMCNPAYTVQIVVGRGRGSAHYLTCDLGRAYIDVNASYRS
jgi:glutamate N-acetyltransferase/amino-acid N-acetyltransferase